MDLPTLAASALTVAGAAVPAVGRQFLAAGPQFARTCELVAVYASLVAVQAPGRGGLDQTPVMGGCAAEAVPTVTVVYAKDCYPLPDDSVAPPRLPPPAALTAWTTGYLGNVWAIHDALLAAQYDGTWGDCALTTVGPAIFTGPTGGVATVQIPVALRAS